jgi:hypothetical protein
MTWLTVLGVPPGDRRRAAADDVECVAGREPVAESAIEADCRADSVVGPRGHTGGFHHPGDKHRDESRRGTPGACAASSPHAGYCGSRYKPAASSS